MTIGKRETAILVGLNRQIETYSTQTADARDDYPHFKLVEFAKENMAAVNPVEWTGQETTSSTGVMNGRSYKRLEAAGFIERLNLGYGNQTTHLRLTAAGKAEAEKLTTPAE